MMWFPAHSWLRLQNQGHEVLLELLFKIDPVDEVEVSGLRFMFKFAGSPAACTSSFHVGHCPDNLGEIVFEGFQAEADVGLAGCQEHLACGLVTIKLGGSRRLKKVLSIRWRKWVQVRIGRCHGSEVGLGRAHFGPVQGRVC